MRVPTLRVSINGDPPVLRTVELRTATLKPGVLCEVWVNDRPHLCIVDKLNADGSFSMRRLPSEETADSRAT